jgi:hypothetical protein
MTPSSVACVCAVIEVMRVRPPAAAQFIAAHETGGRARPHARSSTPYSNGAPPRRNQQRTSVTCARVRRRLEVEDQVLAAAFDAASPSTRASRWSSAHFSGS